ncbi:MAG: diphosphate--fructose-6-phosphate 1-phosphotransferase [Bacteroidales bacterium]|nr:diphosphate--fructose-6-phosphate 1-phosphotransferase [Bacteroidales bacterium]
MKKNVLIAQSGGPSPVINNSLRGIIDACHDYPELFDTIYGGWHGIEGVLKEELLNLSDQHPDEIAFLRTTPAAGSIGTCRYKLKDKQNEDFDRLMEVFEAHNIGYFFYIGGNDSQHTAFKVSELAKTKGIDLVAVGVPKTIDNDVGDNDFKLIDHTPGYGSVAKYWSHIIQNANEENRGSSPADPVLVMQAMGRKIGYIPAAARLADPNREMPLQIYLTESGLTLEDLADRVNDELVRSKRCMVVISEGFDVGSSGDVKDSFGHTSFGSNKISAQQTIVNYLNENGLKTKGAARGQVMGTDQRHSMVYASGVDLDEAYLVGKKAAEIAASGENGWMATILRNPGKIYSVRYDKVPLEKVALSERFFPEKWITENRVDVKDEFLDYVRPLIGNDWVSVPIANGIQRFTKFEPIFAKQKLNKYIPQAERE